ncbi:MAG: NPCBM/NEW2 domain-containing protein [Planctomycetia bacterium]|nr:NPCBM/NEW2 domain-containing protein [Planctomycetia bacterium]
MLNFIALALLAAAPEFQAVGSDGSKFRGELTEFTGEKAVFRTSEGERSIPTGGLVRMIPSEASTSMVGTAVVWVRMLDGTRFDAVSYQVAGGKATISFGKGLDIVVPTATIHSVRLKEQPQAIAEQWNAILNRPAPADLIVIREETSIDYLEGVFGDVTADSVQFTLDGEAIPVKRPKVEGLVYYHPKAPTLEGPFCVVTDRAGSSIQAARTTLAAGRLKITTPTGAELTLPLERVNAIDFPARYLSEMKPEALSFEPLVREPRIVAESIGARYRPRFDQAMEPGPLRLGGREYFKGIALHSRSSVTFLLPEPFVKLTAIAGIDDRVRPHGNVLLTIHGDDRVLLERNITGAEEPLPISLDLTGVTRLKFTVDFGADRIDAGDYLDLCDPRLFQ